MSKFLGNVVLARVKVLSIFSKELTKKVEGIVTLESEDSVVIRDLNKNHKFLKVPKSRISMSSHVINSRLNKSNLTPGIKTLVNISIRDKKHKVTYQKINVSGKNWPVIYYDDYTDGELYSLSLNSYDVAMNMTESDNITVILPA